MSVLLFTVVVVVMAMTLVRAVRGPGLFNRILSINAFGALTVLLLVLLGVEFEQHGLLDIALLYVLVNFIGAVAVLRFFEDRKLPAPDTGPDRRDG